MATQVIVDLSHWQALTETAANFRAAAQGGCVAVIHKATQGVTFTDSAYTSAKQLATPAGLLWGAYHFGVGDVGGADQADYFLSVVKPDAATLIALDLEGNPQGASMTLFDAEQFVKRIFSVAGRYPVVYTSASVMQRIAGNHNTILSSCPLWIASYRPVSPSMPVQWKTWALWQHTNGTDGVAPFAVPGLGAGDMSAFNPTFGDLATWWTGKPQAVPVTPQPVSTPMRTTDTLNIRKAPSHLSQLNGQVTLGTLINVNKGSETVDGQYTYIQLADGRGWVLANYLAAPVNPKPAPQPNPPVAHSKMGFHILPGPAQGRLIELLAALANAGKPIAGVLLCSMGWDSELHPGDIKKASPHTEVMLRHYRQDWDTRSIDWNRVTAADGQAWMREYLATFPIDKTDIDYLQIINEPAFGTGTAAWWTGALNVAESAGIKLAVGCFSVGTPPLPNEPNSIWSSMYPVLRRVRDNGHCLMLHQYIVPDPGGSWLDQWTIMRHKQLLLQFPADLQNLPIRFGEFGTYKATVYGASDYVNDLRSVDALLRGDTVRWCALWSVGGGGGWTESLLDDKLDAIQAYLLGA